MIIRNQLFGGICALLLGIAPYAHSFTHEQTKTFTFIPTSLSGTETGIDFLSCREMVEKIKENPLFDDTNVKIHDKEAVWQASRGIQIPSDEPTVMLYSHGFRGFHKLLTPQANIGQGFVTVYKHVKCGIINCPVVGFDYLDGWLDFDFGANTRISRFTYVFNDLLENAHNIVLYGMCIGAKTVMDVAINKSVDMNKVKAIALETPFFDLDTMARNLSVNIFAGLPGMQALLHGILKCPFSCYNADNDIDIEELSKIPTDIPLFIGHLHNDQQMENQTIKRAVDILRDSGHTVYLLVIDNPAVNHARIGITQPFIKAINAFYKAHDLPHNEQLANEGKELLERALENTFATEIKHIESV